MSTTRLIHFIKRLVALTAISLVVFLGMEFGARLYVGCCQFNVRAYRLTHPPQDADSPYWSIDFVNEYDRLSQSMTDWGYFIFNDFRGHYYTIEGGARRTVGQPKQYTATVWLFGNSGTFDPYVPDCCTMASQLQELLTRANVRWRVVNLAVNAAPVSAELARLEHTDVKPGDIVIFTDGMIDRPHKCNRYSPWMTKTLACQWIDDSFPSWNPQPAVDRYDKTVAAAAQYAAAKQITFYHFLQPVGDPQWIAAFGQPFVFVPPDDFFDGDHLDRAGDSIVAHAIFDELMQF